MNVVIFEIFGSLIVFTIIFFALVVVRHSRSKSYFYRNYNSLDSLLGIYSYKENYKYEEDVQYYIGVMEKLKRFLVIENYFIAHEITGNREDLGNFSFFLAKTNNLAKHRTYLNGPRFGYSIRSFRRNFSGIVFSCDYDIDFAYKFCMFASTDPDYYIKESLAYKFLLDMDKFQAYDEYLWINNVTKYNNNSLEKLFKNFINTYLHELFDGCSVIVVYDNKRLTIMLSDPYLDDAKSFENHFESETDKIDNLIKFFQWAKYSCAPQQKSIEVKPKHTYPEDYKKPESSDEVDVSICTYADIKSAAKIAAKATIKPKTKTKPKPKKQTKASKKSGVKKKKNAKAKNKTKENSKTNSKSKT